MTNMLCPLQMKILKGSFYQSPPPLQLEQELPDEQELQELANKVSF